MAKYEINLSAAIYKIHAGHHDQVMPSCGHYETRGRNGQCTLKTKRGNVTSFLGGVPNVSLPKKKTFIWQTIEQLNAPRRFFFGMFWSMHVLWKTMEKR